MIRLKITDEFARLTLAGGVLSAVLTETLSEVRSGLTTRHIDQRVRDRLRDAGATPILLGYGDPPFPGACCLSIDEEVAHAAPSERELKAGSLLTVDIAARLHGVVVDMAWSLTVPPGVTLPEGDPHQTRQTQEPAPHDPTPHETAVVDRLLTAGRDLLAELIGRATPGRHWSTVIEFVPDWCRSRGVSAIPELNGHGVGFELHESPAVPIVHADHRYGAAADFVLEPGLVITVEPALTSGEPTLGQFRDPWTLETIDGSPAVHFEQTIGITDSGPVVLTPAPDIRPG